MNPDTIGCVWTGEFDLNTLRVDGDFFESGKKNLRIQKYPDTCGRGLRISQAKKERLSPVLIKKKVILTIEVTQKRENFKQIYCSVHYKFALTAKRQKIQIHFETFH